jgi:hypothetical protein
MQSQQQVVDKSVQTKTPIMPTLMRDPILPGGVVDTTPRDESADESELPDTELVLVDKQQKGMIETTMTATTNEHKRQREADNASVASEDSTVQNNSDTQESDSSARNKRGRKTAKKPIVPTIPEASEGGSGDGDNVAVFQDLFASDSNTKRSTKGNKTMKMKDVTNQTVSRSGSSANVPVKRGRGRPPKNQLKLNTH